MKSIPKLEMIQQHNLVNVFDLSVDYFKDRININFFEGVHFFPQSNSKTKKVVLWDILEVKKALKNSNISSSPDPEVAELLKRR